MGCKGTQINTLHNSFLVLVAFPAGIWVQILIALFLFRTVRIGEFIQVCVVFARATSAADVPASLGGFVGKRDSLEKQDRHGILFHLESEYLASRKFQELQLL